MKWIATWFTPSPKPAVLTRIEHQLYVVNDSLRVSNPQIAQRIDERFKGVYHTNGNSYTTRKQYIYLCTKNADYNEMMYVALHELAHVGSKSYGHGPEFQRNFAIILERALSLGIYQYVNYNATPKPYCEMTIDSI